MRYLQNTSKYNGQSKYLLIKIIQRKSDSVKTIKPETQSHCNKCLKVVSKKMGSYYTSIYKQSDKVTEVETANQQT